MLTVRVLITIAIISIGSLNAMSFSEDIIMMGTLNNGDDSVKYLSKNINEFNLYGNFIFIESNELRRDFLNLLGQQVMVSGKKDMLSPTLEQLQRENPSSQCLRYLSIFTGVFRAEKIQPVTFYQTIIPEKIDWNKPIEIKFQFENPLDKPIENIELEVWTRLALKYGAPEGPFQKSKFSLAANEKKILSVFLDPISNADKRMEKVSIGMPSEDLEKIGFGHSKGRNCKFKNGKCWRESVYLKDENTGENILFEAIDGKVKSWKRQCTDCIETFIHLRISHYGDSFLFRLLFEDVIAIYDSQGQLKNK